MEVKTRTSFIPLARPDIREEDIALVVEVLQSGMLVQGKWVEKLEAAFAEYHGVRHAIAVSNGTATLHLALVVLGIGPGDEVIVPAFSYTATANVVELVGATCVFVDVDSRTFNIDVAQIEEKITTKTKAIIPVHEFGLACNIAAVCDLAAKFNLPVIEDAACALGAKQNNKLVGTFGLMSSFSLHPRKSITSGEGGLLLTNDDALATKLRQLRNHGIEMEEGEMNFVEAGFNYRMTDFQAALAWSQFQRIGATLTYKNELAEVYLKNIDEEGFDAPHLPPGHNHTWQTFHLLLKGERPQKGVIKTLRDLGIGTNYGAQCIPAQTYYQKKYNLNFTALFPNAYKAYTRGLALPLYERLSKEEVETISKTINQL